MIAYVALAISVAALILMIAIILILKRLISRRPLPRSAPAPPQIRYVDRPTCAVHRGPIEGDWPPVMISMKIELMGGVEVPTTMFICQGCAKGPIDFKDRN